MTESLKSVFAIAENYPALQASGNFMELQKSLTDAEHTIQQSRRFYNGNVRDFNTRIQVFSNEPCGWPSTPSLRILDAQTQRMNRWL